jgi:hypothetical protein
MTVGTPIDGNVARTSHVWNRPSWWNLLVVLPWAIGFVLMVNEWRTDSQIAARQRTTSGVITAHDPANHDQYGYKFELEGKSYTGWEGPKGRELAITKTVMVYYDPKNPNKNALTDFHELATASVGPVPLTLFGIGAVAVFIFYRRRNIVGRVP